MIYFIIYNGSNTKDDLCICHPFRLKGEYAYFCLSLCIYLTRMSYNDIHNVWVGGLKVKTDGYIAESPGFVSDSGRWKFQYIRRVAPDFDLEINLRISLRFCLFTQSSPVVLSKYFGFLHHKTDFSIALPSCWGGYCLYKYCCKYVSDTSPIISGVYTDSTQEVLSENNTLLYLQSKRGNIT